MWCSCCEAIDVGRAVWVYSTVVKLHRWLCRCVLRQVNHEKTYLIFQRGNLIIQQIVLHFRLVKLSLKFSRLCLLCDLIIPQIVCFLMYSCIWNPTATKTFTSTWRHVLRINCESHGTTTIHLPFFEPTCHQLEHDVHPMCTRSIRNRLILVRHQRLSHICLHSFLWVRIQYLYLFELLLLF